MNEEIRDEVVNEETEDNSEDVREEETSDEIRDNAYANDDIIEMLRKVEKRFDAFDEKLDSAISMMVDSGAMVQDIVDDISENEREDYDEDFINIDAMDLAL